MSIYEQWLTKAFTKEGRSVDAVWDLYLPAEQKIYEYILEEKVTNISGTVKEIAERFNMTVEYAVAFIDGINEVLPTPYDVNSLEEDTEVNLEIAFDKLYKKMVEYKADHLYNLPQWDNVFTKAERDKLYKEQRNSRTIVKGEKIGRNDPCPCGSNLFKILRKFDFLGIDIVYSEVFQEQGEGAAIMNRLKKAAGNTFIEVI